MKEKRRIGQKFQSLLEGIEKDLSGIKALSPGASDGKSQHAPTQGRQVCMSCHIKFQVGDMLVYYPGKEPDDWYLTHYHCPEKEVNSDGKIKESKINRIFKPIDIDELELSHTRTPGSLRRLLRRENKRNSASKPGVRPEPEVSRHSPPPFRTRHSDI